MAEFWARIAADRGGHIAVAPFSRRVSPPCIILPFACSRRCGHPWGRPRRLYAHDISDGDGGAHGRNWKRLPILLTKSPAFFARDGVSSMHAAYSIGKPDGAVWALVFRNAPGLTQAIWGQDPVNSGTVQHCERRVRPVQASQSQPVTVVIWIESARLKHNPVDQPTLTKHLPTVAPTVACSKDLLLSLHSAHALTCASK